MSGEVTITKGEGYVSVSRIQNRGGMECWIHDLECDVPSDALDLMSAAVRQAKDWGFEEVWANVSNLRLAEVLTRRGWTPEQIVFKEKI